MGGGEVGVTDVSTSIDDIHIDERGGDGYLPPLDLSGFGEEYDDCGDDIVHFCTDCGSTFPLGRTCNWSVCMICVPMWAVDKAENDAARLQTVAKTMSARLGVPVYKHHLVFSPPEDWYLEAEDVIERTRKVVAGILKLMNAEGLVAYHGWTEKETDDRGEWKGRLFEGRDFEGDVRAELKPNDHFHCIVASPFVLVVRLPSVLNSRRAG